MNRIRFYSGEEIPVEMHKVRIVQKLSLLSVKERLKAVQDAGSNTFLLKNRDVYLDMLTDSGVNAMSDRQLAAMMEADDSYAGSETFARLEAKCTELFGTKYFLPAHQGRACEHILAKVFVKPGTIVPMNYHFTTTKAHIVLCGGSVVETPIDEAYRISSAYPFKGNMDIDKLRQVVEEHGASRIAFVRMEAGTNLIGGQPFSLDNLAEVKSLCGKHGIPLILDASLLADNLYFIKVREEKYRDWSIREIARRIADLCDIIYFSGRKLGCARGGGMMTSNAEYFKQIREFIPLYEGFLTYGGMSVREMEAIAVGLEETMEPMISHGPSLSHIWRRSSSSAGFRWSHHQEVWAVILTRGVSDHLPYEEYPAGALAAAIYRQRPGMERAPCLNSANPTVRSDWRTWSFAPGTAARVFTLSQVKYVVDRVSCS